MEGVAVRHTEEGYCFSFFEVVGDDGERTSIPFTREYVKPENIHNLIGDADFGSSVVLCGFVFVEDELFFVEDEVIEFFVEDFGLFLRDNHIKIVGISAGYEFYIEGEDDEVEEKGIFVVVRNTAERFEMVVVFFHFVPFIHDIFPF